MQEGVGIQRRRFRGLALPEEEGVGLLGSPVIRRHLPKVIELVKNQEAGKLGSCPDFWPMPHLGEGACWRGRCERTPRLGYQG